MIKKAETEIVKILEKLELDMGVIVNNVSIIDNETTTISDDKPQLLRRVSIDVHRLPGTHWGK